jgi:hypothetical protein
VYSKSVMLIPDMYYTWNPDPPVISSRSPFFLSTDGVRGVVAQRAGTSGAVRCAVKDSDVQQHGTVRATIE